MISATWKCLSQIDFINIAYHKLNLNASDELFWSLGNVVDRVIFLGCHVAIGIHMGHSQWVLQVHLRKWLGGHSHWGLADQSPLYPGPDSGWRWWRWFSPPCCSPPPKYPSPPSQWPIVKTLKLKSKLKQNWHRWYRVSTDHSLLRHVKNVWSPEIRAIGRDLNF